MHTYAQVTKQQHRLLLNVHLRALPPRVALLGARQETLKLVRGAPCKDFFPRRPEHVHFLPMFDPQIGLVFDFFLDQLLHDILYGHNPEQFRLRPRSLLAREVRGVVRGG